MGRRERHSSAQEQAQDQEPPFPLCQARAKAPGNVLLMSYCQFTYTMSDACLLPFSQEN